MPGTAVVTIQDNQWTVGLATAPWELVQGLGGMPEMPPETGMLFDTGWEHIIRVTTVPMLFPIDIAFLSEQLVVTEIYRNVPPGYLVTSTLPARFFLEVNAGELEDIEAGDRASVELLPYEETPVAVHEWASVMISFMGFVVMAAMVRSATGSMFENDEHFSFERKPAPKKMPPKKSAASRKRSKPKSGPAREDVTVETWFERDRSHVRIDDRRTGETLIEWWDEDVEQLFEDGFFKRGRDLEDSVLDYAEHLGVLAVPGNPGAESERGKGQKRRRIRSAYLANWQYGGYSYVEEDPARLEHLWIRGSVDYAAPDEVIALAEEAGLSHIHLAGSYWEEVGYKGWGEKLNISEARRALAKASEHFGL